MLLFNIISAFVTGALSLWLVNSRLHLAGRLRSALNAVVVNTVCIWVLYAAGFWAILARPELMQ